MIEQKAHRTATGRVAHRTLCKARQNRSHLSVFLPCLLKARKLLLKSLALARSGIFHVLHNLKKSLLIFLPLVPFVPNLSCGILCSLWLPLLVCLQHIVSLEQGPFMLTF